MALLVPKKVLDDAVVVTNGVEVLVVAVMTDTTRLLRNVLVAIVVGVTV